MTAWAQSGTLTSDVAGLLRFHGFDGQAPTVPPRMPELRNSLQVMAQTPSAAGGSGWTGGPTLSNAASSSAVRWDSALPPDFKRAASEIYRSIRSSGNTSVRDFVNHSFAGDRTSHVWRDLWVLAQEVDVSLAAVAPNGDGAIFHLLATSDTIEMSLRRIAAYIYEERTRDYVGAAHMQGIVPPGSKVDIAPTWVVGEATQHSKAELQRDERISAARKRNTSTAEPKAEPKKGPKGGGKGGQWAAKK